MLDDDDLRMIGAVNAAGEVTFERLHRLVAGGYEPELGAEIGAIWLAHPARKFRYRTLMLCPDGTIVSPQYELAAKEMRIERTDHAAFRAFLADIPRPTTWQKLRAFKETGQIWLFTFIVGILGGLLAHLLGKALGFDIAL